MQTKCARCGTIFKARPARLKQYPNACCSKQCGNAYRTREIAERFWEKVNRRGPVECWLWTAATHYFGYGTFRGYKSKETAHRTAWMLTHGDIPAGFSVLHKCDNPACCNPAHLFLGTALENVHDMDSKGRRKSPRGSEHWRAKLTESTVKEIRRRYSAEDITHKELAKDYFISQASVTLIVNFKSWKHVT